MTEQIEERRDAAGFRVVRVPVIPLKPIMIILWAALIMIGGWYGTNQIIICARRMADRFVEKRISEGLTSTSFYTKPTGNARDFETMTQSELAGALYMTFQRYNSCVESKAQAVAVLSDN